MLHRPRQKNDEFEFRLGYIMWCMPSVSRKGGVEQGTYSAYGVLIGSWPSGHKVFCRGQDMPQIVDTRSMSSVASFWLAAGVSHGNSMPSFMAASLSGRDRNHSFFYPVCLSAFVPNSFYKDPNAVSRERPWSSYISPSNVFTRAIETTLNCLIIHSVQ